MHRRKLGHHGGSPFGQRIHAQVEVRRILDQVPHARLEAACAGPPDPETEGTEKAADLVS
jgi:hypothetical protein